MNDKSVQLMFKANNHYHYFYRVRLEDVDNPDKKHSK